MPIEIGIWRFGDKLERLSLSALDAESKLEDLIAKDISVFSPQLMLVGRQIPTVYGKFIDLLALDSAGRLTVIELKRDRTLGK